MITGPVVTYSHTTLVSKFTIVGNWFRIRSGWKGQILKKLHIMFGQFYCQSVFGFKLKICILWRIKF